MDKTILQRKNEIVMGSCAYLKRRYGTSFSHLYERNGGGLFTGRFSPHSIATNYNGDLEGFEFRKDFCRGFVPCDAAQVNRDLFDYLRTYPDIVVDIDEQGDEIDLYFDSHHDYIVSSYVEDGHAGSISIRFSNFGLLMRPFRDALDSLLE